MRQLVFVLTLLYLTLLYLPVSLNAQGNLISGKVIDQAGLPVTGASIAFKGSPYFGTMTTPDGTFRTFIPPGLDTIVCTHVNFKKKSDGINGNNYITLVLEKRQSNDDIIPVIVNNTNTKFQKNNNKNPVVEEARHFTKVEIDAGFPGGRSEMTKYLQQHISFPDSAGNANLNGIVKVGFTIGTDGQVKNIILLKGISKLADEAVMAAVSNMPKWKPALQNGRYAEYYKEISISFKVSGKKD